VGSGKCRTAREVSPCITPIMHIMSVTSVVNGAGQRFEHDDV
jgi:hypothetical protein